MSQENREDVSALPLLPFSERVEYEFQYLNHAGTWQSGFFEKEEGRARNHFNAMANRFPRQGYRLIRRTLVDEIISQNAIGEAQPPAKRR